MAKYLSALVLVCLLFAACRKNKDDDDGGGGETAAQKANTILSTQIGAADVYRDKWGETADTVEALNAMCNWIIARPEVSKAYLMNDQVVRIEYKNGLASSINLIYSDPSGTRLTRGGGPASPEGGYKRVYTLGGHNKSTSELTIPKNKVLIFAPYHSEFGYPSVYPYLAKFNDAPQPLEVTVVTDKAASLTELKKVNDYGLVILNTHGLPGGFQMFTGSDELDGLKDPGDLNDRVIGYKDAENLPEASLLAGELELQTGLLVPPAANAAAAKVYHSVLVTYKYVRTLSALSEAIVFGNHCYSGGTHQGGVINNMPQAWLDRGAISYYGYAFQDGVTAAVDNEYCKRWEDSLISNLMRGDSTGIAHLANDVDEQSHLDRRRRNIVDPFLLTIDGAKEYLKSARTEEELIFKHFHDPRYSYDCTGCGTFTDPRDGEKYRIVCIGGQTWLGENLRWAGAGICYDGNSGNCKKYGRLYSIQEATGLAASSSNPSGVKGICPQGWHVPSQAEVVQLINAAGGTNLAHSWLKSKSNWPAPNQNTDTFCFRMFPSGRYVDGNFSELGLSGEFWMTRVDEGSVVDGILHYYSAHFTEDDISVGEYLATGSQDVGKVSCRCVKD